MRIAALVMTLALFVCQFVGCGGSKNKSAAKTSPPPPASAPDSASPADDADADKAADPVETKGVDPCQGGQKP